MDLQQRIDESIRKGESLRGSSHRLASPQFRFRVLRLLRDPLLAASLAMLIWMCVLFPTYNSLSSTVHSLKTEHDRLEYRQQHSIPEEDGDDEGLPERKYLKSYHKVPLIPDAENWDGDDRDAAEDGDDDEDGDENKGQGKKQAEHKALMHLMAKMVKQMTDHQLRQLPKEDLHRMLHHMAQHKSKHGAKPGRRSTRLPIDTLESPSRRKREAKKLQTFKNIAHKEANILRHAKRLPSQAPVGHDGTYTIVVSPPSVANKRGHGNIIAPRALTPPANKTAQRKAKHAKWRRAAQRAVKDWDARDGGSNNAGIMGMGIAPGKPNVAPPGTGSFKHMVAVPAVNAKGLRKEEATHLSPADYLRRQGFAGNTP